MMIAIPQDLFIRIVAYLKDERTNSADLMVADLQQHSKPVEINDQSKPGEEKPSTVERIY